MTKEIFTTSKRKGITPIIAIIILLLITIALAGAAYSYINMYWQSLTGKNIMVVNSFCTAGDTANILIRNVGTLEVILGDIKVTNTATGGVLNLGGNPGEYNWTDLGGTSTITALPVGETGKFSIECTGYCTYMFIYGGAVGASTQQVSVACR